MNKTDIGHPNATKIDKSKTVGNVPKIDNLKLLDTDPKVSQKNENLGSIGPQNAPKNDNIKILKIYQKIDPKLTDSQQESIEKVNDLRLENIKKKLTWEVLIKKLTTQS